MLGLAASSFAVNSAAQRDQDREQILTRFGLWLAIRWSNSKNWQEMYTSVRQNMRGDDNSVQRRLNNMDVGSSSVSQRLNRTPANHSGYSYVPISDDELWQQDSHVEQSHRSRAFTLLLPHSLRLLIGWLLRGIWWVVACTILGIALGVVFLTFAEERFTSETAILVDPTNLNLISNDIFNQNTQRDAQLMSAESKLGVLTSGNVLTRVVGALELQKDTEFAPVPGSASAQSDAIWALGKKISAYREDRSFIVSIEVTTNNPVKSVQISEALVTAFEEELAMGEADRAGQAAGALESRLESLKQELATAEEAIEAFKRDNNLRVRSGDLINSEVASQYRERLVAANSRFFTAQAKYNEIQSLSAQNSITTSGNFSETLSILQVQYAELKQLYSSESAILGPRHPNIAVLQPQLTELEAQIQAEMSRLVNQAKAEMLEAEAVLRSLSSEVESSSDSVFTDSEAQVKLRQLQRDAEAKAAIYEAFLSRAGEASQRQQIDSNNIRVITPAMVPNARSWPPRSAIVLAASAILGFGLGCALVVLWGLMKLINWSSIFGRPKSGPYYG